MLSTFCAIPRAIQIGTWKAGQSIIYTGIRHPSSVMKNVIPIVMAGGTFVDLFAKISQLLLVIKYLL